MEEINFSELIGQLKSRWRTILYSVLVTIVIAVIIILVMPQTYEGESVLLFPEQQQDRLSQLAQLSNLPITGDFGVLAGKNVYSEVLKSRTISQNILDEYRPILKGKLKCKDLQDQLKIELTKDGALVFQFDLPSSWLKDSSWGSRQERTSNLAAEMTNAYIKQLSIYDRSTSMSVGRKNRVFIEGQIRRTKAELAAAEKKLESFQEDHTDLLPPEQGAVYPQQLRGLITAMADAKIELESSESELSKARSTWHTGAPAGISPEALVQSPIVSSLQSALSNLEVSRATLLEEFTEAHPQVVSVDQQIQKTRAKLQTEMAKVLKGQASSLNPAQQELLKQIAMLEIKCRGLTARLSGLAEARGRVENLASSIPSKERAYIRLVREVKSCETVYTTLLAEHAKARVAESRDMDKFVVLDKAVPQEKPVKPNKAVTLAGAFLLGMMIGVYLAGRPSAVK